MNLASALIRQVLEYNDFDTWINVRKHYLPNEYHILHDIIEKHSDRFHKLPTVEELKLEIRDNATLDKVYALESIETDAEPFLLLDYLKNEYAQKEALFQLDRWIDRSIAFETAEEVVRNLQQIANDLEDKVELGNPEDSMQKIELFDTEEDMAGRIVLGINKEFDDYFQFRSTDYIMFGGRRGSGKSIICSNIANNIVETGKIARYFSIEMEAREILQRCCASATNIPFYKIRNKNLDNREWEKVAAWWATRYRDGPDYLVKYMEHRDFSKFHATMSKGPLSNAYVDVVYDPNLTLARISAETDKILRTGNLGVNIVDYINKVKRNANSTLDHLDWKEQLNVSHKFKTIAQDTKVPMISPFQTDASGEARIAKGILDSPDAVFVLKAHKGDIPCITFTTTKMRAADEEIFTSEMNWNTLKIGPRSVEPPAEEEKPSRSSKPSVKTGEGIYDN